MEQNNKPYKGDFVEFKSEVISLAKGLVSLDEFPQKFVQEESNFQGSYIGKILASLSIKMALYSNHGFSSTLKETPKYIEYKDLAIRTLQNDEIKKALCESLQNERDIEKIAESVTGCLFTETCKLALPNAPLFFAILAIEIQKSLIKDPF